MTLLSDLVAVLLPAAARDLREHGESGVLQTSDLISISRFLDVAAALVESLGEKGSAHFAGDSTDLEAVRRSAAGDLSIIESARRRRA